MDDATSTAVASPSTGTPTKPGAKGKRLGRGLLDLLSATPVEVKANEFTVAVDAAEREAKSFVSTTPIREDETVGQTDEVPVASPVIDEAVPPAATSPAAEVVAEIETESASVVVGDAGAAAQAVASGELASASAESLPTPEEELAAIAGNLEAAVRLLSEHRDTPLLLLQRSLRVAWAAALVAALLLVGVVWWAASTTSMQRERIERLHADLAGKTDSRLVATDASAGVVAPAVVPLPVVDRTAELNRLTQELDATRSALTKANAAIDELMSKPNRQ